MGISHDLNFECTRKPFKISAAKISCSKQLDANRYCISRYFCSLQTITSCSNTKKTHEGDYLILTQDCRKVKTNESLFVTPPPSNVPGEWDIKAKALKQKPCNDQVTHHNSPISVESWKLIRLRKCECNGSEGSEFIYHWHFLRKLHFLRK